MTDLAEASTLCSLCAFAAMVSYKSYSVGVGLDDGVTSVDSCDGVMVEVEIGYDCWGGEKASADKNG